MTNTTPFETYWDERVEFYESLHYQAPIINIMKTEAEKAWNHARSFEHESILEVNVIINKGIWNMITEHHNKDGNNNGTI